MRANSDGRNEHKRRDTTRSLVGHGNGDFRSEAVPKEDDSVVPTVAAQRKERVYGLPDRRGNGEGARIMPHCRGGRVPVTWKVKAQKSSVRL